jgi:serine/threonine-protein kinase
MTQPFSPPSPDAAPSRRAESYIGQTVDGRYVIDAVLGEGGMGVVYRGRHKVIDKKIALKVLKPSFVSDAEVASRFLNEARSASSIGNPHIVDISDFGTMPDGATYFVMEYLDGQSLAKLCEETRGPLPEKRIVRIAKQIAEALDAAHKAGIVHRDLKPDNVMLVDRGQEKDFVKILDFGIAKVGGDASKLTKAGQVFGTPHYMSPEQAAGLPVDKSTDIYSLGVILYEMSSGKPPFDADNFMGILTMHMYKQPPPIRALVPPPEVSPGLEAVILKCLSKKPELRYPDMAALAADLERLERGQPPEAVNELLGRSGGFHVPADYFARPSMAPPVHGRPPRARPRWGLVAGIAGVAGAMGLVAVIFAVSRGSRADVTPPAAPPSVPSATTAPPTTTPPAKKVVAVAVEPIDAKVTRGGIELTNPVVLELGPEEKVEIVVARAGFVSQTLTIDASEATRAVKLYPIAPRPVASAKPKPTSSPATVPTTKAGGDFVDPWKR